MGRRVGQWLSALLCLFMASTVAAERPTPPAAQRFVAALSRGDLRTAQSLMAPGEAITDINPVIERGVTPTPVTLATIAAAVRNCRSTPPDTSRDLADPSNFHVFLDWECGEDVTSINLDVVGGRIGGIEVQFRPIPLVQPPPGWVEPLRPPPELADGFLRALVGARDFRGAGEYLTKSAVLIDRRSGRRTSLTAIANHVEPCTLGEISSAPERAAIARWTCPSGPRFILIGYDRNNVSRVEIGNPPSPR
jgi:hypothetical protein